MCCNEPTDHKMLTKFFPDIFVLSYGKDVTPIYWGIGCAIYRPLSFGWKIKILGSIFSLQLTFWSDSHGTVNCVLFQSMERCISVEWELEKISDLSLSTNQVLKVVYSYFKSSPE